MLKFKKDAYSRARGGSSRFLEISCRKCENFICYYQKDGPGNLRRMYLDRMLTEINSAQLTCRKCGEVLGHKIIYKKENRPAYRLFVDAVSKKVVPKSEVEKA